MTERSSTKEVAAICRDCGAVYPARRLPSGELVRESNVSFCRCGSTSFAELDSDE